MKKTALVLWGVLLVIVSMAIGNALGDKFPLDIFRRYMPYLSIVLAFILGYLVGNSSKCKRKKHGRYTPITKNS